MDRTAFAIFSAFATSSLIAFFCFVWMSSSQIRMSEGPALQAQETVR